MSLGDLITAMLWGIAFWIAIAILVTLLWLVL